MDYLKIICSLAAIAVLLAFLFLIKRSENCKKIEKTEEEKTVTGPEEETKAEKSPKNEEFDHPTYSDVVKKKN